MSERAQGAPARGGAGREALAGIPHPPGTSAVDSYGAVAHLSFPREHRCEYLVAELRTYSGSEQELRTFYANAQLEGRWDRGIGLFFTAEGRPPLCGDDALPRDFAWSRICAWASGFEGRLYAVYAVGGGDPPGWDPRCHFVH